MDYEFTPKRSLIFTRVAREEYRHKHRHWLYRYHIADSISQFAPYVAKYAMYPGLPVPSGGDVFGAHNQIMTEHYWFVTDADPRVKNKTFAEYFPPEVLRWQGNIPDVDPGSLPENLDGDRARQADCSASDETTSPFTMAYVPVWWDEDLKGTGRTAEDGPNYRWLTFIKYPEGVSRDAGDQWFFEEFAPLFVNHPSTTRFLTSRTFEGEMGYPFARLFEIWFEGPEEWVRVIESIKPRLKKPEWASIDTFPYFKRFTEVACMFLGDIAESNNLTQYQGYITMR